MCGTSRVWSVGILLGASAVLFAIEKGGMGQSTAGHRDSSQGRREQCVLLRNGNVLVGQVQREGESYLLTRQGVRVRLAGYQVEAIGNDLSALYAHQSQSLPIGQAAGHMKLAEWCLRHGLLDEARREVAAASRLAPGHPRLDVVERRLAVASDPASSRAKMASGGEASASAALAEAESSTTSRDLDEGELRLRELPEDSMEQFRRRVQPLLLNSCTTSGCHRSGGSESFVLDRRALWRDAPQTMTVQNLVETLNYVDRAAPSNSRLLQASGSLHAPGLSTPPLSAASAPYAVLENWLLHICGQNQIGDDASQGQSARESPVSDQDVELIETASEPLDVSDAALDELLSEGEEDGRIIERSIQRGLRPVKRRQSDPFDPEDFNRRFSPRRRSR